MTSVIMKKENNKYPKNNYPMYCDYSCKYASFTSPEVTGACRRDLSVYCKLKKKYNNKNSRCFINKK